ATPDLGQDLRLAQAVAEVPLDWSGPRPPLGEVFYDQPAGTLLVPLENPQVDPLSLIADAGPGGPLFGAPQKSPDGRLVRLPLLGVVGEGSPVRRSILLTFITSTAPLGFSMRV